MNLSEVLTAIANGDLDGDVNAKAIVSAINARSKAISAAAGAAVAASLKPGDRVRITGDVRPAHFRSREGEVTSLGSRGKISVRLDGDIVDTRVPPAILSKVGDAVVETVEQATARLIAAYKADHDQYPQYHGRTDGAVAVPLRTNWKGRGENLAAGTLVLLLPFDTKNPGQSVPGSTPWSEKATGDQEERITLWHPHMTLQTSTFTSEVVMPNGAR